MANMAMGNLKQSIFSNSSDAVVMLGVIAILMVMIIPLPSFILDFLLATNITLSIIVILMAMYTIRPLDFDIFPTLLLVTTLFRLSLNVASTRLILLHGNEGALAAGKVIKSFGSFVVGGNYVVGLVVFAILVLINFVVITKGAGRIAEVAARFTLDAMPGKQMAIDADLNAGLIDESQARKRRDEISREAEFHGAMDGASKFVRGDAIAGIIITVINIIGGFVIGVLQQGMPMVVAAQNYTLLTVGDGLVSQIPALIISTAAGILVSRSASENSMGADFARQLSAQPRAIFLGAFVIFMFGLIPGLPHIPFIVLGLTVSGIAWYVRKTAGEAAIERQEEEMAEEELPVEKGPEPVEHLLSLDPMELEVGYGIIPLVDREQNGELLERIRSIRRQFATEMGMVVPPIHIRDNLNLKPAEYRILIKGVESGRFELMTNHLLAMDPGGVLHKVDGVTTREPAFDLPAIWVLKDKEDEAKFAGYTVVDNAAVVATHLTELIRRHADDLLGRQEVQALLDNLGKTHPKAVEELIPNQMSVGGIQKVLQNLLRENVSIRDMLTIVETLADYAPMSKDPDLLTEYVRQRLARAIVMPYLGEDRTLSVITLDPEVEDTLNRNIQHTEHGSYLSVDPKIAGQIMTAVSSEMERGMAMGLQPIVLCSPVLRRHFRRMVEQFAPSLMVMSHSEVVNKVQFKSVGKVSLTHAR
ncbi:flagellar biosynthesis protein FlhA [Desulfatibacillum alkenivorans DSM 16219]|jgi:flagellar biosynthesis protein FlhA|uniref:Flagellar biosynthesis protein FlhA n=1 Tax=Desulfatibacillum alkenivorans DSM 16219 TaxID=1121393 RepID=A0A1M6HJD8_9BACT|nr:flagellar biosynthesis protein FlhA [Desulfatibacillum alkenivorans]SHJ22285.1 flagellar biosynthesis protein FlhA [Desulfatibacillum alkenivorans DSM 16219]